MKTILLIDDNLDNLNDLKTIINESVKDVKVIASEDGLSGIEMAAAGNPDVILLDVVRSKTAGFEICRRLKKDERTSDIPVVFITEIKGNKEIRSKALAAGAEGFLHKPIDETELVAQIAAMTKIKKAISGKRQENERLSLLVNDRTRELQKSQTDMLQLVRELKAENESRKKIEEELSESEELFRSIFEYHTAIKFIIDPLDGNIIDANIAAANFYGWSKDQLKKMNIREINVESVGEIYRLMQMARNREKDHFEFQHRLADGSIRDVEVFSSRIEVKGKFLLHSIVHDISNRKEAERAIILNEARLRRAELASKTGNWEIHLGSKIVSASVGARKIYGLFGDPITYDEIKMIPLPEFRPMMDLAMKQMLEEGQPYDIEFKIEAADSGEQKDIHSIAQYDAEQKIVFGVIQDITERKKIDQALYESEQRFKQLVERMQVGVLLQGPKAEILLCNPMAVELLGLTEEQLVGKTSFDPDWNVIHEDGSPFPGEDHPVPRAIENREAVHNVVMGVYSSKRDERVWLLVDAEPQLNADGTVLQVVCTFIDISSRKLAEEALKESEALLRELNATKDKFFSIIAHDLKSPFNNIVGFSDLLLTQIQEKDFEGIEKYAGIINTSAQRVMDLLMNLLEWSRSQTGRMEFNPEYIEIYELVNSVVELLEETARQKSIRILKNLPRKTVAFADFSMISTILRNLISNAIKFTNPGGLIEISVQPSDNELMVCVADNGVGIKKEIIRKLFRIEESLSTAGTRNERGTGLGLILCKEFIEKHGGRIWAESEPGKGSKFFFSIPEN